MRLGARVCLAMLAMSGFAERTVAQSASDPAGQLVDIIRRGDSMELDTMSQGALLQTFPGSREVKTVTPIAVMAMVKGCEPARLTLPLSGAESSANTGFVRATCLGRVSENDKCRDVAYEFSISFLGGPRIKFDRFDTWSTARCGPQRLAMPPIPAPLPPKPTISMAAAQLRGGKVRAMMDAVRNNDAQALSLLIAPDSLLSDKIEGPGVRPTTTALQAIMKGCEKRGPLAVDDDRVVVSFACTPPRADGDLVLLVYFSGDAITRIVPTTP